MGIMLTRKNDTFSEIFAVGAYIKGPEGALYWRPASQMAEKL